MSIKINVTLDIADEHKVYYFEQFLRDNYTVNDFKIVPNTKELYRDDPVFQKICKGVKDAQLIRDRYINSKK
jgi:hypothetical protein